MDIPPSALYQIKQKKSPPKIARTRMNGYNLFLRALKKKGVANHREISSKWWCLTPQQRDALNEQANSLVNDLVGHKQLCDDNVERYVCQYCGCKFAKKVHMRQHLGECKVANPEQSMCKFCRNTLASAFSLNRHFKKCKWATRGMVKPMELIPNDAVEHDNHLIEIIETMSTKAYMCLKCKVVRFEYLEISNHVESCIGKSVASGCAICTQNLSRSARIQHLITDHSDFSLIESVEKQDCEMSSSELETIFSSGDFLRDTSLDFDSLIAMDDQTGPTDVNHTSTSLACLSNTGSTNSLCSSESISYDLKTVISMCKKSLSSKENSSKNRKSSLLRVKPAQTQKHIFKCNFCEFSKRSFPTKKELQQHWMESHKFLGTPYESQHDESTNLRANVIEGNTNISSNSTQFGFGVSSFDTMKDDNVDSEETIEYLFRGESNFGTTSQVLFRDADESEPPPFKTWLEEVVTSLQSISCPVCQGVFATGKLLDKHVREIHLIEL